MNWHTVSANYTAFIPRILTRWPELDEENVEAAEGNHAALRVEIMKTLELSEDEANAEIEDWMAGEVPADVVMDPTQDNDRIKASRHDMHDGEDAYADDAAFGDDNYQENPVGRSGE